MKKALVLLLAFALVGAAFAAPDADLAPSVSGSATISWGVLLGTDPENATTGFKNEASAAIKMPLIKKATVTKGEGDVYGFIELKDFQLGAQGGATAADHNDKLLGLDVALPTVTAKIVFGPAWLAVYSWGGIGEGFIAALKDNDVSTAADFDGAGALIGYAANGLTLKAEIGSNGDWTANTDNDYALGAYVEYAVSVVTAKVDFAMDLGDDEAIGIGLSAPIALTVLKGLTITPSFDMQLPATGDATWDAGAAVELKLSDNNADGNPSKVTATVYYSGVDEDLEAKVAFVEVEGGGLVENLKVADLSFFIWDALAPALADNDGGWLFNADASYKIVINETNNVEAGVIFSMTDAIEDTGSTAEDTILKLKAVFTNTDIANTTITATYASGDVIVEDPADPDLGSFILAAKVAY